MPKRTREASAHAARRKARGSPKLKLWGYKSGLNSSLVHRHVVTCSTSTVAPIYVLYPSSGVAVFSTGGVNSANMQVLFTLGNLVINLAGTSVMSVPLPNAAELVALYDQYVIEKVELSLWTGNTMSQTGTIDTGVGTLQNYYAHPLPLIGWAPDMDDATNTSITQLQQYSQYKCKQLGASTPLRTSVVPCCADTIYRPGATSAYARAPKQAINCSYQDVPHYGVKFAIDGFQAGNAAALQVDTYISLQAKYHLKMMSTR